ncbi:MAG: ABC transporter permease [Deltaproteobacteria bacterium]|nr:ABC transporter permease [Deltaproteobacteria bacterium]
MKNLNIKLGVILVISLVCIAIFAPWISPHDPNTFYLDQQLEGPHAGFWFGNDTFGRDVLSRIFYGARVSLGIGFVVVSFSMTVGVAIGVLAGWYDGIFDLFFSFISDIFLAFPGFLLAVAVAAFVGPSIFNVIFILSLMGWVSYARLARGQVLVYKEREFIRASKGLGASNRRLILKHLLPNLAGPLLVQATFGMAGVILVESTLSFLGLGVPVEIPSWGNMLDQGTQYLLIAPHLSIFPGFFIMLVVLGFNFLGDGLRDRLDPRREIYVDG